MFVRRKHNKSGTTAIQVVAKIDGKYRVQKSFGCSREESVLSSLERKAVQWAEEKEYGGSLFEHEDTAAYDAIFASIGQSQLRIVGPDLIYGRLFDKIGINRIKTADDEMFKSLVVTRLYRPGSKLKTLNYMAYFINKYYSEDKIYRFLDELCWRPKTKGKLLDGLKRYTTNCSLPDDKVVEEYGYLFMIECAFRFCKTDLDIRPM